MTRGLPGSGKSTWSELQVHMSDGQIKRINKDDLRFMIDAGKWDKQNEKLIIAARNSLIRTFLIAGKDVIVDDTNFSEKHENDLRDIATEFGAEFEIRDFNTPLDECIQRDIKRDKSVGKKVIMDMWEKYLKPTPYPMSPELPDCFIFDIDGTLAKMNGRSPYDYSKVLTDYPNYSIVKINKILRQSDVAPSQQGRIFIFSGREDSCRMDTAEWLYMHGIEYDRLVMRKTGDSRKDAIVKREFFDEYIRGKYNPVAVFDDRDRVVSMWRSLGLTCCQVDYGAF